MNHLDRRDIVGDGPFVDDGHVQQHDDAAVEGATGPCISSGWTSMRMPRGGRPLVIAKSTPRSCSCSIASTARGVTTLTLVTTVPSTSAGTAAIVWGVEIEASAIFAPTFSDGTLGRVKSVILAWRRDIRPGNVFNMN